MSERQKPKLSEPETTEHEQHAGRHTDYACGFSGPHCWKCNEPWPCRSSRGIEAEATSSSVAREWSWMADDYEAGTAFITDDPHDSQAPIVDGLAKSQARAIVRAHNASIGLQADAVAALEAVTMRQVR